MVAEGRGIQLADERPDRRLVRSEATDLADLNAGLDGTELRASGGLRAARLVLFGQAQQKRVQLAPLILAQRLEVVGFEPAGKRTQGSKRPFPLRRDSDEMPAPILRVTAALNEPSLLELVEKADELAAIVTERIGDGALCFMRSLAESDQHGVVVRVKPNLVVGLHRPLLRCKTKTFEKERRGFNKLFGKSRAAHCRAQLRVCNGHVNTE
jgi:hypothetical protein